MWNQPFAPDVFKNDPFDRTDKVIVESEICGESDDRGSRQSLPRRVPKISGPPKYQGWSEVASRSGVIRLLFTKSVSEGDQVSIWREHQQFALAVRLVDRPIDVIFGERVELRLEFRVELVDVAYIDVVREAPITRRSPVGSMLFQNAEADGLAMQIRVVRLAEECLESEDVVEELHRLCDVLDMHEGRYLDEVRLGVLAH